MVSPLPAQPQSDYDYASALATKHLSSWVDGRVPINGTYQQDAFTDRELVTATATPTPTRPQDLHPLRGLALHRHRARSFVDEK